MKNSTPAEKSLIARPVFGSSTMPPGTEAFGSVEVTYTVRETVEEGLGETAEAKKKLDAIYAAYAEPDADRPGAIVLAPKGVPHTYRVESPQGGRCLTVTVHGDFERFVRAMSRPASGAVTSCTCSPADSRRRPEKSSCASAAPTSTRARTSASAARRRA